jgi:hypothetical protein
MTSQEMEAVTFSLSVMSFSDLKMTVRKGDMYQLKRSILLRSSPNAGKIIS